MLRLLRSSSPGSAGQGVSTTARTSSPPVRAASNVSNVWLIVPSPGRAATTTGRASSAARSRTVYPLVVSGTSSPPTPSTTTASAPCAARRIAAIRRAGSMGSPASFAARWGDTGAPKRSCVTCSGGQPAAAASTASSGGQAGAPSGLGVSPPAAVPVRTGL